ncbi:MAG: DNA primase [Saccharofermentans sp.]|nr:DNA primase [Saccharofermentans sp.]
MARIPESTIDEILSKADIESVVGRYVTFTKRTGQNLFGLCPFHSEKTPSFSISIPKNIYKCFGCQKSGNAIGFIMELEKLSFPEAVKYLGDQYGVEVEWGDDDSQSAKDLKSKKDRVRSILSDAAVFYYKALNSECGKPARDYAAKRGLTKETLVKFGIGYAPDGFDNLVKHLRSKGYTDDELQNSGLFTVAKNGNLVDLFRGRFIVPIFDAFGKIIAFGGRNLGPELPKYVNSPDSLVYKKQEHLYGLNFAKKAKSKQLIIVEGYMDAIAMHQAGIENAVAALGTAFTDSQLRLASKYAEEIVFFFDSDQAGKNAAIRATHMMLNYLRKVSGLKIRIKIAAVPNGKDPDEYIKTYGAESFKAVVNSAKDVNDYLFSRAYDDNFIDGQGLDLTKFQEDIVTYGSWIYDEIKREKLATEAAQYLSARPETILNAINHAEERDMKAENNIVMRTNEREEKTEVARRKGEIQSQLPNEDLAYMQELELFVRAIRLGGSMANVEYIKREDVIRKKDFFGKNMQDLAGFYLEKFNPKNGVSDALLLQKMSEMTLNGQKAEVVYLAACDSIPEEKLKIEADKYKKCLYQIRVKRIDMELNVLADMARDSSDSNARKMIEERMQKAELYKEQLLEKESML